MLLKVWESGSGSDRTLPENVRPWLLYEQRHKKSPKKKEKKKEVPLQRSSAIINLLDLLANLQLSSFPAHHGHAP